MKAIIHVGLPKTATTSLQQSVFEEGDGKYWRYLGVRQPRYRKQEILFKKLMDSTSSGVCNLDAETFDGTLPVLLSEEMITVDSGGVTWQQKIRNLAAALKNEDVTILVTLRSPSKAMFSLYVELYKHLKYDYRRFEDFVEQSNQAQLYNYEYFVKLLDELFGKDKVKIVPFESIKNGSFVQQVCEACGVGHASFTMPHTNSKKRTEGCVYSQWLDLNEWLLSHFRGFEKYSVMGVIRGLLRRGNWITGRIPCPWGRVPIEIPNYEELNRRFEASNAWLIHRCAIDYTHE